MTRPDHLASAVAWINDHIGRGGFYFDGHPKDAADLASALLAHARALGWTPPAAPPTSTREASLERALRAALAVWCARDPGGDGADGETYALCQRALALHAAPPVSATERERRLVESAYEWGPWEEPLTEQEVLGIIATVDRTHPRPEPSATLREWARVVARAAYAQCGLDEATAHVDEHGDWQPSTWDVDAVIDSAGPPPVSPLPAEVGRLIAEEVRRETYDATVEASSRPGRVWPVVVKRVAIDRIVAKHCAPVGDAGGPDGE